MTDEELQSKVKELTAKGIEIERPVAEHDGWTFGERAKAVEDDEDSGIFAGEPGTVIIERVGAAEYNNERTALFFIEDGMDAVNEVNAEDLEAIDA